MKIAFIGIGNVGFALADKLEKKGHQIIVGNNDLHSKTVSKAVLKNKNFNTATVQAAIDASDIIFLATPFMVNETLLKPLHFNGKTLVDCTNPVGPGISHGLKSEISGAEMIQKWAQDANVVKAYTIYGYENLQNTIFPKYNVQPVMMIAGNNEESKQLVSQLNTNLGFETLNVGNLDQALHLEHMTLLWVKMVRRDGHHPNFSWAYLER